MIYHPVNVIRYPLPIIHYTLLLLLRVYSAVKLTLLSTVSHKGLQKTPNG